MKTDIQAWQGIHSARYILEDVKIEQMAEISGLPEGVIADAFKNIFKCDPMSSLPTKDRDLFGLFAGSSYYPLGGADDFKAFGTVEELKKIYDKNANQWAKGSYSSPWGQIVSLTTMSVLYTITSFRAWQEHLPKLPDLSASTCSADVAREIAAIEREIKPKLASLKSLRDKMRELKSREWIAANNVTIDDIETPEGDGKPWFDDLWRFAEWLKWNSQKRFASWNGTIYFQSDLKAGKMPQDMSGRMREIR